MLDTTPLATIYPEDVDPEAALLDYSQFLPRTAGRAIIFDGDTVALLYVGVHGYYMLPGGGVDAHEDVAQSLEREILEELGCTVHILGLVGSVETYIDRWKQKQTDFCYTARKVRAVARPAFTDFERSEGFKVVWARDLDEAIRLSMEAIPENRDGKLVRARDLLFLEYYKTKLTRGLSSRTRS